jgi:hypothetical protein
MLYLLYKKKKDKQKAYIGDRINVIYRFKGVFFIITGFCVFNREKNIGIFSKKKGFFVLFSVLKKSIYMLQKLDTYFFNKIG